MTEIKVDTYKLIQYSQRLESVNSRIGRLDARLNSLYAQVNVIDLWNLIQADILTSYSLKLARCKTYLQKTADDFDALEKKLMKQDPLNFTKPTNIHGVAETLYDVGVAVKKRAQKIKKAVVDTVQWAADSYVNKGEVYQWVQYGKAVMKAAKGVAKVVKGVGLAIGTGGVATPIAVLSIISASNDIYNAIMDATYTYVGDYDKIGTNALKERMKESGGIIGGSLGNQELGEKLGEVFYYGADLVTSIAVLDKSYEKIKRLDKTDFKKLGTEIKEIGGIEISIPKLFTTDMESLKYQAKLAKYAYKETSNFITNVGELKNVFNNAVKVGKTVDRMITVGVKNHKNPVIDVIDSVSNVTGKIGSAKKISVKVTKLFFG